MCSPTAMHQGKALPSAWRARILGWSPHSPGSRHCRAPRCHSGAWTLGPRHSLLSTHSLSALTWCLRPSQLTPRALCFPQPRPHPRITRWIFPAAGQRTRGGETCRQDIAHILQVPGPRTLPRWLIRPRPHVCITAALWRPQAPATQGYSSGPGPLGACSICSEPMRAPRGAQHHWSRGLGYPPRFPHPTPSSTGKSCSPGILSREAVSSRQRTCPQARDRAHSCPDTRPQRSDVSSEGRMAFGPQLGRKTHGVSGLPGLGAWVGGREMDRWLQVTHG